jgi:hypothetical protein
MERINLARFEVGVLRLREVGVREYLRTYRLYREFVLYSLIFLGLTATTCGGILASVFLK